MKIVKILAIVLIVAAGVIALFGPIGPVPGFMIGGTPTPAPAQWPDTSKIHEVKLAVPGTLPRVVIIWMIQHESELYVVGAADSGWVTMIGDGSPVQLRIEDNTYDLQATPVTDNWEPIVTAYVAKYEADYPDIVAGFPTIEEAEGQFGVFHLSRN